MSMAFIYLTFLLTLVCPPNMSDGSKLAVNDEMIVTVYNDRHQFAVQFASALTACISNFSNSSYIASVALGRSSNRTSFAFVGEDLISHQLFISSITVSENCTFNPPVVFFFNVTYQEHFVFAVHPTGQFVFGFWTGFILVWEPDTQRSDMWPSNTTFSHYAVDNSYDFVVIVGYANAITPVIYLIDFNSCHTSTTFQNCMTIVDILVYNSSTKANMSVKTNDDSYVLWSIGSQMILLNMVNHRLNLINTLNFTDTIKALAWTGNDTFAVLIPSQVLFYSIDLTLLSTFPNAWKTLCSTMTGNFDTITSSEIFGLAILDVSEYVYVIRSTTPGYYPVTNTGCSRGIPFAFSNESTCPPGSYHYETSSRPCALCPQGTFNHGKNSVECVPCNDSSFCPLGAVANVNGLAMSSVLQARAYPQSPDSTIFDDILLQNMFSLNFSRHCLLVSPIFWTLLMIACTLLLLVAMGASKRFVRYSNVRETVKYVFKQADLIGEGEMWVGGMVSFSIIVLTAFAYAFSALYLRQYPIETTGDATFACNPNLRNSKFSTQMQLLGIPLSDDIQPIFNMLDNQPYTLNVDFVNTLFRCQHLVIQQTVGNVITSISPQNCSYQAAVLAVVVTLPFHTIAIQLLLNGTSTVGGIRVGLSGPAASSGDQYQVQQLGFIQNFSVPNCTLSQNPSIELDVIPLINATEPLNDAQSTLYSALWVPTFIYVPDQIFFTEAQYTSNPRVQIQLTLSLSEKSYYVMNTQSPIAKEAEIIFHSILFTTVCLELFGLVFVIFKLLLVPIFKFIVSKCQWANPSKKYETTTM